MKHWSMSNDVALFGCDCCGVNDTNYDDDDTRFGCIGWVHLYAYIYLDLPTYLPTYLVCGFGLVCYVVRFVFFLVVVSFCGSSLLCRSFLSLHVYTCLYMSIHTYTYYIDSIDYRIDQLGIVQFGCYGIVKSTHYTIATIHYDPSTLCHFGIVLVKCDQKNCHGHGSLGFVASHLVGLVGGFGRSNGISTLCSYPSIRCGQCRIEYTIFTTRIECDLLWIVVC